MRHPERWPEGFHWSKLRSLVNGKELLILRASHTLSFVKEIKSMQIAEAHLQQMNWKSICTCPTMKLRTPTLFPERLDSGTFTELFSEVWGFHPNVPLKI